MQDWSEEAGDVIGIVLTIGIKNNQNIGATRPGRGKARLDCLAVASVCPVTYYFRPGGPGRISRGIPRTIIDDNDLIDVLFGLQHYCSDVPLLVESRHCHDNSQHLSSESRLFSANYIPLSYPVQNSLSTRPINCIVIPVEFGGLAPWAGKASGNWLNPTI